MGLFDTLGEIGSALNESEAARRYGPDWRQRRALAAAQLAQTEAETQGVNARTRGAEASLATEGLQQEQLQEHLRQLRADEAALGELYKAGKAPVANYRAAQFLREQAEQALQTRAAEANIEHTQAQTREAGARSRLYGSQAAMFGGAAGVDTRGAKWVTLSDGEQHYIDRHGRDITDKLGDGGGAAPPPTADQRNMERYDVALPVMFDEVQASLDGLKKLGWNGSAAAMVPGTAAYNQSQGYTRLVTGLSATIGRALGDNRITDADRPVYTAMFGVANRLAATPPGTELAQQLLTRMRSFSERLSTARRGARAPGALGGVGAPQNLDEPIAAAPAATFERGPDGKIRRKQ